MKRIKNLSNKLSKSSKSSSKASTAKSKSAADKTAKPPTKSTLASPAAKSTSATSQKSTASISTQGTTPRRRRRRRGRGRARLKDNGDPEDSSEEDTPKEGWVTSAPWSAAGKTAVQSFIDRYSALGIDGVKEEFKKEVADYRAPDLGDTAWKASPVKNRLQDGMTCPDATRVELSDGRYVNANWAVDEKKIVHRFILTQFPLIGTPGSDAHTNPAFWAMVFEQKAIVIVYLSDLVDKEEKDKPPPSPDSPEFTCGKQFWPLLSRNGIALDGGYVVINQIEKGQVDWRGRTVFAVTETCRKDGRDHSGCVSVRPKPEEMTICPHLGCRLTKHVVRLRYEKAGEWNEKTAAIVLKQIAWVEGNYGLRYRTISGPIVVLDDHSGLSRASILVAADVMGCLLFRAEKHVTLPGVVKWLRRCRAGAIRNEEDYVMLVKSLFVCFKDRQWSETDADKAKFAKILGEETKKPAAAVK